MKKLILIVALTIGLLNISTAQQTTGTISLMTTGNRVAGIITTGEDNRIDIKYATTILECEGVTEILSLLPTVVWLTDGKEGHIEISYPEAEAEYLKFLVKNDKILTIGRDPDKNAPKNTLVTERTPIEVRVSASTLNYILNKSDMSLYIERDAFADKLIIANSSGLFIHADSISADIIELLSVGTTTCYVDKWNANSLMLTNTGALFIKGVANAQKIEHHSAGIDNIELDVACKTLEIVSTGSGVIKYKGSADDVNVTSLGSATIRTSELNKE